ncbi:type II secretion system protein J [Kineosporia sp. A_224]|uniref:PulJ/GspJ family protein n=1 Tax=Kineosporia sp. A_224 TaxID=1962180 RepID=UPI000B4A723D|nr:type II secretion system protein [Kineosporia sp. A_224]
MTRRPRPRDEGTTLVELLVGSILLTVVLAVSALAITGMIRTAGRLDATAASAQDARRAVDAVRRGLASAELVNPPATVGADTYLEARTAAAAGGPAVCRQWRVVAARQLLQTRTWTVGTTTATAWVTLSTGVANTTGQPAFALLPADDDWAQARVVVDLRLRRATGGPVPAGTVVPLTEGSGDSGGVAAEQVCAEVARS